MVSVCLLLGLTVPPAMSAESGPGVSVVTGLNSMVISWDPVTSGSTRIAYLAYARDVDDPSRTFLCRRDGSTLEQDPGTALRRGWGPATVETTSCAVGSLPGGRRYEAVVEAYRVETKFLPLDGAPLCCTITGIHDLNPVAVLRSDAVTVCCVPPSGPLDVVATDNGGGVVSIDWSPPTDPGGATSLTYEVVGEPEAPGCTTTDTACTVRGLREGVTYRFSVTAMNAAGPGPAVAAEVRVVAPQPGQARGVRGRVQGQSIAVSWRPPTTSGVTGYEVAGMPGRLECRTSGRTSCMVRGIRPGVDYTFRVRAVRSGTRGPWSLTSPPVTRPLPAPPPTPVPPAPPSSTPDKPTQVLS